MGHIRPPSASLVLGRSGHVALETNFRQKIESREDAPRDVVLDAYSDAFEESALEVEWEREENNRGYVKDSGYKMVDTFHKTTAPAIQPVATETRYEIEFDHTLPKLVAILDLEREGHVISDFKFRGKKSTEGFMQTDMQMTCYDYVYRATHNMAPYKLEVSEIVNYKKGPEVITATAPARDDAMLERFVNRLVSVVGGMESGIAVPNPNGWHCSEKFCGYWKDCPVRA
jgi:hypothetical protein